MNHINFLHKNNPEEKTKINTKKWLFLLLLFFFLGSGISLAYNTIIKNNDKNDLIYSENALEPKKPEGLFKKLSYLIFNKEVALEGSKNDRINVLLLGMGGLGHDGPYLTDTIMIASLKPSTNEVALISIPRDLGVYTANYGLRKINSLNSFGEVKQANMGGAYATEIISKTFGLDIQYYLRVDFNAFEKIIDEVGGVKINVERSFTDYMYPTPNYLYQTLVFEKGIQTLNGETALKFVRSRHGNNGEGSDFARAERQQKVIMALKEKILSFGVLANPVKIKNIIDTLESHITTNMTFEEMVSFGSVAKELQSQNIKNLVIDNGINGYLVNYTDPKTGAFMLAPNTGNFLKISDAIQNIFENDSTTANNNINGNDTETPIQEAPKLDYAEVEIQNGTWQAGLATRLKEKLVNEDFFVNEIGNIEVELKPFRESGIYAITSSTKEKNLENVLKGLNNELKIPIKQNLPTSITTLSSSTDILVILGDNFVE
ncbi:MAG: LCP family protein [Candidatus Magasanikbacteria bacterium]